MPFDLVLFNNLHVIYIIKNLKENIEINSIPNIYDNKYYKCKEFIKINQTIKFGIIIYQTKEKEIKIESIKKFFFVAIFNNYKRLIEINNEFFDPLLL